MGFPALFYYLEKVWKHLHKICMSRELEYPPQTPVPALLTPCPGPAPWTLSHQGGIPAQPPCFTPGRTLAHQVFPAQKDCLNHESPINTCPGFRAVQCCSVCSSHPAQPSLSLGSCKCLIPSSSSSLGPAQRRTLLDDVVIFPEAKQVVQSSGWINSPWKFYVSRGLEAAALSRVSPGMRWLHPAFPAGNNQAISLGFPLLRTEHFVVKQVFLWCCEVEREALKSRDKPAAVQMEDEFSHLYQDPGRSPGKAGVSHFRSSQVNNKPLWNKKRAPQSCSWCLQSVRSWFFFSLSWITKTKYLFECTGIKFQNITGTRGCWLSLLSFWNFYELLAV